MLNFYYIWQHHSCSYNHFLSKIHSFPCDILLLKYPFSIRISIEDYWYLIVKPKYKLVFFATLSLTSKITPPPPPFWISLRRSLFGNHKALHMFKLALFDNTLYTPKGTPRGPPSKRSAGSFPEQRLVNEHRFVLHTYAGLFSRKYEINIKNYIASLFYVN